VNILFPEQFYPEGFAYYPEFVTAEEEDFLLNEIQRIDLHPLIFQGYEAKRKVASFGFDWNFQTRQLSIGKSIPSTFGFLLEKVGKKLSRSADEFAELLITEYPVGSVINWHRDAPPFDVIVGVSLLSDCVFRFRPYDKTKRNRRSVISVPLSRRSLYIMQGPCRTDWEHSIPAMHQIRYSITLRTLK